MKKILTMLLLACACFSHAADDLYFWVNNTDLRYTDQTYNNEFFAYITWVENGETKTDTLTITRATVTEKSGRDPWGQPGQPGRPGEETTRDMTLRDLQHSEPSYSGNESTVVYELSLGGYTINQYANPVYTFTLELDMANGTQYTTTFTEADVWQGWYLKDHICSGLDLVKGQAIIPEPNAAILIIMGVGLLGLKRKKSNALSEQV